MINFLPNFNAFYKARTCNRIPIDDRKFKTLETVITDSLVKLIKVQY